MWTVNLLPGAQVLQGKILISDLFSENIDHSFLHWWKKCERESSRYKKLKLLKALEEFNERILNTKHDVGYSYFHL